MRMRRIARFASGLVAVVPYVVEEDGKELSRGLRIEELAVDSVGESVIGVVEVSVEDAHSMCELLNQGLKSIQETE